jgi:hypothetical protein
VAQGAAQPADDDDRVLRREPARQRADRLLEAARVGRRRDPLRRGGQRQQIGDAAAAADEGESRDGAVERGQRGRGRRGWRGSRADRAERVAGRDGLGPLAARLGLERAGV